MRFAGDGTMLKRLRNQDGYITLEVTFVFTIIFFSLILIIFIGINLYQQVALQSSVQIIASQGAAMHAAKSNEVETGKRTESSYKDQNPYINFINIYRNSNVENILSKAVEKLSNQNEIYSGTNKTYSANIEREFMAQNIVVSTSREYKMPIVSAAEAFGIKSPFKINAVASAPVTNPVELIRTVDICADALMYFDETAGVIEKFSDYREKLIKFIGKLDIEE
jgi:Flp pilus assembly protein TadG